METRGLPGVPQPAVRQRGASGSVGQIFYLLLCLDCEPLLPMPFYSQRERGEWASGHTAGTGHEQWRVWQEPA